MAMLKGLWSLNGLAVELCIERRTLAKRLTGLAPADERRVGSRLERRWYLADVVGCLNGHTPTDTRVSNLDVERARLAKLQADRIEVELAKTQGELIPVQQVIDAWSARILAFRAKMLALPAKTARVLAALDDFKEIAAVLREEIEEALTELVREELDSLAEEAKAGGDPVGAAAAGLEEILTGRGNE
jgi:phage terminase Nu1 subunit (DNA packaging protein)